MWEQNSKVRAIGLGWQKLGVDGDEAYQGPWQMKVVIGVGGVGVRVATKSR